MQNRRRDNAANRAQNQPKKPQADAPNADVTRNANNSYSSVEDPKVKAKFEHNEKTYNDVNPTARNPELKTGEALPKPEGAKGMSAINRDTTKAHAELGAMNQSYNDGNRGGKGVLTVEGQDVCKYCRQDIKKMARCLELDELVVNETSSGKTYTFQGNPSKDFLNNSDGGKSWR